MTIRLCQLIVVVYFLFSQSRSLRGVYRIAVRFDLEILLQPAGSQDPNVMHPTISRLRKSWTSERDQRLRKVHVGLQDLIQYYGLSRLLEQLQHANSTLAL